jgi:hypothetical protein
VRVPIGAPGLSRLVFHFAHLVHVDKRIQSGGADPGERPNHREALALVASRASGDRSDWTLGVGWARRAYPGQCECVCGDSRHVYLLI